MTDKKVEFLKMRFEHFQKKEELRIRRLLEKEEARKQRFYKKLEKIRKKEEAKKLKKTWPKDVICCVYVIFLENNLDDCYIGSSTNFYKRVQTHLSMLKKNKHDNINLQNLYNLTPNPILKYTPLFLCKKEELKYYEERYIYELKPTLNIIKSVSSIPELQKHKRKRTDLSKMTEEEKEIHRIKVLKEAQKKWRTNNSEKLKEYCREYARRNPEVVKKYREKNYEKYINYQKEYRKNKKISSPKP